MTQRPAAERLAEIREYNERDPHGHAMELFAEIDALQAEKAERDVWLDLCANWLEISSTYLQYHGRESEQKKNCVESIDKWAEMVREFTGT